MHETDWEFPDEPELEGEDGEEYSLGPPSRDDFSAKSMATPTTFHELVGELTEADWEFPDEPEIAPPGVADSLAKMKVTTTPIKEETTILDDLVDRISIEFWEALLGVRPKIDALVAESLNLRPEEIAAKISPGIEPALTHILPFERFSGYGFTDAKEMEIEIEKRLVRNLNETKRQVDMFTGEWKEKVQKSKKVLSKVEEYSIYIVESYNVKAGSKFLAPRLEVTKKNTIALIWGDSFRITVEEDSIRWSSTKDSSIRSILLSDKKSLEDLVSKIPRRTTVART